MLSKGKIRVDLINVSGIVNKMLKTAPKHKKSGTTVISQNGKVYIFNYKKKK